MEYWKVKKSIREVLEQNKEKISDRAEARVIKMSQKGYTSMMEKHTMSIKKLEEIALIFDKPLSYFFVTEEIEEKEEKTHKIPDPVRVVEETGPCLRCGDKDKLIAAYEKQIELLEFSLGKSRKNGCG